MCARLACISANTLPIRKVHVNDPSEKDKGELNQLTVS